MTKLLQDILVTILLVIYTGHLCLTYDKATILRESYASCFYLFHCNHCQNYIDHP